MIITVIFILLGMYLKERYNRLKIKHHGNEN